MGDNPNMVDQIFSIGVLAFILALVILMKDIIDGGTFAPSERRSALLGFGLAGLLVLSALTMSMIASDTIQYQSDDNNDFIGYYYDSTNPSFTPNVFQDINDVVVQAHTSSTANNLQLRFNNTYWTPQEVGTLRQINFNLSVVPSSLILATGSLTSYSNVYRDSTDPDVITVTSTSTDSYVNISLSSVQAMNLQSQMASTDYLIILIGLTSSSSSIAFEFDIQVENEKELANFLIWAVMSFALYIPLMIYLDAFNNVRRFVNNPFDWGSRNRSTRGYRRMQRRMRR